MRAGDIKTGDVFIAVGVRVKSVMHEGEHTFVSWNKTRPIDSMAADERVLIYPHRCPECGCLLVADDAFGGLHDE